MSRQSFKGQSCPNCTIEFDSQWKDQEIVFCPLHAQAEGMRDMLTRMADYYANACNCTLSTNYTCMVHQARAILRAMEEVTP